MEIKNCDIQPLLTKEIRNARLEILKKKLDIDDRQDYLENSAYNIRERIRNLADIIMGTAVFDTELMMEYPKLYEKMTGHKLSDETLEIIEKNKKARPF